MWQTHRKWLKKYLLLTSCRNKALFAFKDSIMAATASSPPWFRSPKRAPYLSYIPFSSFNMTSLGKIKFHQILSPKMIKSCLVTNGSDLAGRAGWVQLYRSRLIWVETDHFSTGR